jgi:hypothetical protein
MYELTYESVAMDGLSSMDIEEILKVSRCRNTDNNVTGCLIYYNRRFIQILEGDEEAVKETYASIKSDRRHKEIHLIAENETQERTFPQWGMAYFPINERATGKYELEQFRRNLKLLADFSSPATVTTILFWKKVRLLISENPSP